MLLIFIILIFIILVQTVVVFAVEVVVVEVVLTMIISSLLNITLILSCSIACLVTLRFSCSIKCFQFLYDFLKIYKCLNVISFIRICYFQFNGPSCWNYFSNLKSVEFAVRYEWNQCYAILHLSGRPPMPLNRIALSFKLKGQSRKTPIIFCFL